LRRKYAATAALCFQWGPMPGMRNYSIIRRLPHFSLPEDPEAFHKSLILK